MSMRKRSRKSAEKVDRKLDADATADVDFNQSSPWKIVMLLIFLAGLAVLLLQNDDPEASSGRKSKKIPNPESPLPPSPSVMYTFKHAAVSSDSQVCSDIARSELHKGSNIFDAAISSLLCLSLTQIQSMGLLGGFLLTAYIKSERKSITIDAQMTSPKNFEIPKKLKAVKHGGLAVATPGFLKGLWEIHKKYGKLPWKDLVEPTRKICYEGITISKHLYDSMHFNKRIASDPYLREVFVDEETGRFKRPGTKVVLKEQCEFLEILASQGDGEDIYAGFIGDILAEDFKNASSIITKADLIEYKVKFSDPVEFSLSEEDLLFVPRTAAVQIPSILNICRKYEIDLDVGDLNETIVSHHRVVEAFKHVFAMRSRLGDPDFVVVKEIVEEMLSEKFADDVRRKIDDEKTFNGSEHYLAEFASPNDHGTSHLSIVSEGGDAISATSSINYYFGAGITGHHTGLVMNNGMDDFSYPNRDVNYFGLSETPTNYPQPGKRALSSMSPIIVVEKKTENVKLVIGAAGGSKIISALSLALLRYSKAKNLKEIVDAPRFHHQLIPDEIEYEYGLISGIVEGLAAKGHKVRRFNNRGTIVNALACNAREINGIADYRKDWSGVAGY